MKRKLNCEVCGKKIGRRGSWLKDGLEGFCSAKCRKAFLGENGLCLICEQAIDPGKRKHAVYCSDACRTKASIRRRRRRKERMYRETGVEVGAIHQPGYLSRICEFCGNDFVAKRADSKTCSVRCRVALHRMKSGGV